MSVNLTKIHKGVIAVLASVLASSMLLSVSTATNKAFAADIIDTPDSIGYDASERVPAVETMIGRGALAVAGERDVAVPGVKNASAALLRVSVFHARRYRCDSGWNSGASCNERRRWIRYSLGASV